MTLAARTELHVDVKFRWLAGRDGEAHARRSRTSPRVLCGLVALDERFAWPASRRCSTCVRLALAEAQP